MTERLPKLTTDNLISVYFYDLITDEMNRELIFHPSLFSFIFCNDILRMHTNIFCCYLQT